MQKTISTYFKAYPSSRRGGERRNSRPEMILRFFALTVTVVVERGPTGRHRRMKFLDETHGGVMTVEGQRRDTCVLKDTVCQKQLFINLMQSRVRVPRGTVSRSWKGVEVGVRPQGSKLLWEHHTVRGMFNE